MNKRSRYLFISLFFLSASLVGTVIYLSEVKSLNTVVLEKKQGFISLTQLPDLALSTESYSLRHRSLSNIADIYSEDGSLREYTKASFVQSPFTQESQ